MGPFEKTVDRMYEARAYAVPGLSVKVAMNPTYTQAKRLLLSSRQKQLRGLISVKNDETCFWDASEEFHKEVCDALGWDWFGDIIYNNGRLSVSSVRHLETVYKRLELGGTKNYHDVNPYAVNESPLVLSR